MFLFCLVFAMFCARLFICASWSPAGKGLTSWLSFVVSSVSLSLSHWYPGQVWYLIVSILDLCNLTYFEMPCEPCLAFFIGEYSFFFGIKPEGISTALCAARPKIYCK